MIGLRVLVDSFSLCFYLQLRAKIVNADFYIFNLFFICRNSCLTVDVLGWIKGLVSRFLKSLNVCSVYYYSTSVANNLLVTFAFIHNMSDCFLAAVFSISC